MRAFGSLSLLIFVLLLTGSGCVSPSRPQASSTLRIAATIYPIGLIAERVGGEYVSVTTMIPPGAEPHDFEPTARELSAAYDANLFVYNGGGIDSWASKVAEGVGDGGPSVLCMSDVMQDFLPPVEEDDAFDEHFWADPNLMITETEAIRDAIIRLDPSHEVEFRSNADIFLQELRNLDQEYREGLASCETRIAVTSHAAFGYLAKRYDFEQRPIMGLSPEAEPSAGELAALAETARASGVKYIFFETLASPKLSQTLANEIGAQTLVFNPVEGLTSEELEAGEDYLSVMRQNLTNLRTAMLCR